MARVVPPPKSPALLAGLFTWLLLSGCAAGPAKTAAEYGAPLDAMKGAMEFHLRGHWKKSNRAVESAIRLIQKRPSFQLGSALGRRPPGDGLLEIEGRQSGEAPFRLQSRVRLRPGGLALVRADLREDGEVWTSPSARP